MKKALFIDRDGTLVIEPQDNYQVDSLEKLEFYPFVFRNMYHIATKLDFELVMVSNQDGMGTGRYPADIFNKVQKKIITAFENEGVTFNEVLIDSSMPEDNAPTRKPRTGLLKKYIEGDYDLEQSYVIGDRLTDIELAKNLGAKGILLTHDNKIKEIEKQELTESCKLITDNWSDICDFLSVEERSAKVEKTTKETKVSIELYLDGKGTVEVFTGLGFFDHMLQQIGKHSGCDLKINTEGDLDVDEHHTIEDTALALGEAYSKALGSRRGIERYGYILPMDDCLAQVVLDFSGRSWLEWDVKFKREKIGDLPTEMFMHFFKSFADNAGCNLNIKAEGDNEHHKAEAVFKGLGKAIKMAIKRDVFNYELPSTKGVL